MPLTALVLLSLALGIIASYLIWKAANHRRRERPRDEDDSWSRGPLEWGAELLEVVLLNVRLNSLMSIFRSDRSKGAGAANDPYRDGAGSEARADVGDGFAGDYSADGESILNSVGDVGHDMGGDGSWFDLDGIDLDLG